MPDKVVSASGHQVRGQSNKTGTKWKKLPTVDSLIKDLDFTEGLRQYRCVQWDTTLSRFSISGCYKIVAFFKILQDRQ